MSNQPQAPLIDEPLYKFSISAAQRDKTGYYITRWDRAEKITVNARTKAEAIKKTLAVLGDCPRGKDSMWAISIDQIDEIDTSETAK